MQMYEDGYERGCEEMSENHRRLIRNLRLINEKFCPICKENCMSINKAQFHCIKIGRPIISKDEETK